jgi:glutaredoxin
MSVEKSHVPGTKKGDVVLYALSTCQWCRKTKELLNELKVDYYFIDVDLVTGDDQKALIEEIKKYNPACSFPTMVINERDSIVGFDEEKIRDKFE